MESYNSQITDKNFSGVDIGYWESGGNYLYNNTFDGSQLSYMDFHPRQSEETIEDTGIRNCSFDRSRISYLLLNTGVGFDQNSFVRQSITAIRWYNFMSIRFF